jgi:D-amino-acid dehydrogenase
MSPPHVTVIGAGIVGVCSALHLQRQGFQVTLVDRLAPGEGTSFGNACVITDSGMVPLATPGIALNGLKMLLDRAGPVFIRPAYAANFAPWLLRFLRNSKPDRVQRSAKALADLSKDALREHHELADNTPAAQWLGDEPTLYPYESEAAYQKDAFSWQLRKQYDVKFDVIKDGELRELEPALNPAFRLAVRMPTHGRARNPSQLVKAHAGWLQRSGGTLLQREIRDIEVRDGKAVRLITDQEPLDVDTLVIAAGVWSARLSRKFGDLVPLESEGGYHITIQNHGIEQRHPLLVGKFKTGVATTDYGLRIAGMTEFAGLDPLPVAARFKILLRAVRQIFPAIHTEQYQEWRGQRPTLPDSLPVIGRSPRVGNVYYAFGNQHLGLSTGPKTGRLIAQLISGQPPAIDLSPFRVDRF